LPADGLAHSRTSVAPASRRTRVVSVGSLHQDLIIQVGHLPRAGETLHGAELVSSPGGKGANQAVAMSRLGATTAMVGRVGHDSVGVDLCSRLESEGVDTSAIIPTRETSTGVALIFVRPDGENTIAIAGGANMQLSPADVLGASATILDAEVVMLQLEIPIDSNMAALELARQSGALVSLNAAPPSSTIDDELWQLITSVDLLVVNELEASKLLGVDTIERSERGWSAAARQLRELTQGLAVITLESHGAVAATGTDVLLVPSHNVEAVDGVGAGDAFCAGLAIATIEGRDTAEALAWATTCGALATVEVGAQAALPRRRDVKLQMQLADLLPDEE